MRRRPALTASPSSTRRPAGRPTTSSPRPAACSARARSATRAPSTRRHRRAAARRRQVTRLLRFLGPPAKTYTGEIVLGMATSTLDASGDVTGDWDMAGVTLDRRRGPRRRAHRRHPAGAADGLGGEGRRAAGCTSWPARASRSSGRPARSPCTASTSTTPVEPGCFPIEVECSSGTYIRTLAADLGTALGGGAHLRDLRRTAIGSFTLTRPSPSRRSTAERAAPPAAALRDHAAVDGRRRRRRGRRPRQGPRPRRAWASTGDGPVGGAGEDGDLLAVYEAHRGTAPSSPRSCSPADRTA